MATFEFKMTSTPLTGSKSFTGTDADMTALLAWAAVAYAGKIAEAYNPEKTPGFTPTNAQIGITLATETMRGWKDAVQKFNRDAAVAAVQTPPQITFT